jgi:DNA-directed RNA polymerase subunit delta
MKDLKKLAMIDIAEEIVKHHGEAIDMDELLKKVGDIKNIEEDDFDRITQLYMDITQSAKFVFCGDNKWDLKERNLELWDKDGFQFVQAEEYEDDDDLDLEEYELEDEKPFELEDDDDDDEEKEEELDEEVIEAKEYIEVELPIKSTDDDDEDEPEIEYDDYDEDDYNEIMDDYEDMYDE